MSLQHATRPRPLPAPVLPSEAVVVLRRGAPEDARALFNLVSDNREEGHLLARSFEEVRRHAARFFVATVDGEVVGCAELAPLSPAVAEVRSLVVDGDFRRVGVGVRLLERVSAEARAGGYRTLCAFTHEPVFFVRHGFSIVPHVWVPEKIQTDCRTCPLFMRCGQQAVVLPLDSASAAAALDV